VRITDVVTPQELRQIFERERSEIKHLGLRGDLVKKWFEEMGKRLPSDYGVILSEFVGEDVSASQMWRLLCLLDRFLEEKYANTSHTTD
jgi:hypothetical protein